ncbi:MAG: hypothetical protein IPN97_14625 [Saprospiraceae bacterium]|nr:hypothetical protein [Saprospiraceae bacterium]
MGMELFQNSSHYVAADINKDTRVSSSDLIELKRLILGKITKFSNNTSCGFVPEYLYLNHLTRS